jgi:xanthine dehydrogenase accessory factor
VTDSTFTDMLIWIRGAGELASACAYSLHRSGFRVVLSELPAPLAIRRSVCFSEAMLCGHADVEGVTAVKCELADVNDMLSGNQIALVGDNPQGITALHPDAIIDARMLKKDPGNLVQLAPFAIGLGPGFHAGKNCHAVIETLRGHQLGKIIWEGPPQADTGIPGELGGATSLRVIHANGDGFAAWHVEIGDVVREGDFLGTISDSHELHAPLAGLVRGLISPAVPVTTGLKIADIDPRGRSVDHLAISDKARSVGRGALEAILTYVHQRQSDGQ